MAPLMFTGVPKSRNGWESATVTDGGGPLTVTRPASFGARASWNRKSPARLRVTAHDWFALRIGDANDPSSATTWWSDLSALWKTTLSSWLTVNVRGEKPVFEIWTV